MPSPFFYATALLLSSLSLTASVADMHIGYGLKNERISQKIDSGSGTEKEFTTDFSQYAAKIRLYNGSVITRSECFYGTACRGTYTPAEYIRSLIAGKRTRLRGKKSSDFSIGSTYLLLDLQCFKVGPSLGYSSHSRSFSGKESPSSSRFSVHSSETWKGPWVGGDAEFRITRLCLKGGYEYHRAEWHRTTHFKNKEIGRITQKRKSNRLSGHVTYADLSWDLWGGVTIGVEANRQSWLTRGGSTRYTGTTQHADVKLEKKHRAKEIRRDSRGITAYLGLAF